MLLNGDIIDIEKPDRVCLPTFAVDKCSRLFSHPSILSIKLQDLINNKWCFIRILVLINL